MKVLSHISHLTCIRCQREFPPFPFQYTCSCGGNLDYILNYPLIAAKWSRAALAQNSERSIWRYAPLLPVAQSPAHRGIQVGGTPLMDAAELSRKLGTGRILIKDDTRNPSGSLKDRASAVALQHAGELNQNIVVAASTGNAASSLACLAAYHRTRALIVAPATAPTAKLVQIRQYGAGLLPVNSSYDDAFDLVLALTEKFGWYSRNTGVNPVLSEGKKTVALEIAEQMAWKAPDWVFVPVGDGCIIGGLYKGFFDLLHLGWIENMPRLVAVQAENSSAIVDALQGGTIVKAVNANTVADSIAVNLPRDPDKALRAVQKSNGFGITVSDEEILTAQHELAYSTGIFGEPAAAAAYAGLKTAVARDLLNSSDSVVLLITGSGLKDIQAASKAITVPPAIDPTLVAAEKRLSDWIN